MNQEMNQTSETLNPKSLNNSTLVLELKRLVASERKITAEILTYIKEVDCRRLYLNYNCTSLFGFLTTEMGYTKASAQRRIDSARFLSELPEIKKDLESGALNLSQVSMLAQGLRQKDREEKKEEKKEKKQEDLGKSIGTQSETQNKAQIKTQEAKKEILNLIKNKDLEESQKIVAKALDLEAKSIEKKTFQKDESVRLEMTLSKDQTDLLKRIKELISHINPNPSMAELIEFLAKDYIHRKDPLVKKTQAIKSNKTVSVPEPTRPIPTTPITQMTQKPSVFRKPVANSIKREIFKRDQVCQWRNQDTGKIYGSRFQLQIDHKHSVWRGGGDEAGNLEVLCRVHNVLKYEREVGY